MEKLGLKEVRDHTVSKRAGLTTRLHFSSLFNIFVCLSVSLSHTHTHTHRAQCSVLRWDLSHFHAWNVIHPWPLRKNSTNEDKEGSRGECLEGQDPVWPSDSKACLLGKLPLGAAGTDESGPGSQVEGTECALGALWIMKGRGPWLLSNNSKQAISRYGGHRSLWTEIVLVHSCCPSVFIKSTSLKSAPVWINYMVTLPTALCYHWYSALKVSG